MRRPGKRDWPLIAQIVLANAIPVLGVWVYDWQPLNPIFFYWLDGLLCIYGLGIVGVVVTAREDRKHFYAPGLRKVGYWVGLTAFVLAFLGVFPGVAAAFVIAPMNRKLLDILGAVFSSRGVWFSLALAVLAHVGQTVQEIRGRPDLSLKETGEARMNLFIHRALAMGVLAVWFNRFGLTRSIGLKLYVVAVAVLFTYVQLNPERYLRLAGFFSAKGSQGSAVGRKTAKKGRGGEE